MPAQPSVCLHPLTFHAMSTSTSLKRLQYKLPHPFEDIFGVLLAAQKAGFTVDLSVNEVKDVNRSLKPHLPSALAQVGESCVLIVDGAQSQPSAWQAESQVQATSP